MFLNGPDYAKTQQPHFPSSHYSQQALGGPHFKNGQMSPKLQQSPPQEVVKKPSRPTLFNLLEALASDNLTTVEQRRCIRGIVTDFLTNEIPHGKVYAYIGAIIGHDTLHNVIRSLENDVNRSSVLDPQGLMRIEAAFGLSSANASQMTTGSTDKPNDSQMPQQTEAATTADAQQFGFGATNKEEILRVIRRNLNAKKVQGSTRLNGVTGYPAAAGLLQKTCWLPVRRPLSSGSIYGHSMICVGGKAYFIGGSSERGKPPSFSSTYSVSLVDFTSRQIGLSGDIPSQREYNSCNFAILRGVHSVVLFGGFDGTKFLNDLHILDMETRVWSLVIVNGRLPPPRDQHTALIYPARSDLGDTASKSIKNAEYLFIFGGRTGTRQFVQCLNDMWAFRFDSSTWIQVLTDEPVPLPRFGMDAVWTDDFNLCVFGGETIQHSHSPFGSGRNLASGTPKRHLLSDLWLFKLITIRVDDTDHSIVGCWTQESYDGHIGPRSHYKAIFIAQRFKEIRTGEPRTVERLMLLSGGLTYSDRGHRLTPPNTESKDSCGVEASTDQNRSNLSPVDCHRDDAGVQGVQGRIVASDKIFVYFFSQHRWYSLKPNYAGDLKGDSFGPRQLHVMCFFEKRNLTSPEYRPPVPCIFIHGGYHKKKVLSDAWVLSLTGEDPFVTISGMKTRQGGVVPPGHPNGSMANIDKIPPSLRTYPPWYCRETHSPSLLWAFCGMQKWAFGPFSHILHNSLSSNALASNVHVRYQLGPEDEPMLSIQDDGHGLDYVTMNKLLKLFGHMNLGGQGEIPSYSYGCGFKLAFSRLATSCVIMSRTHNTIGIGMISQELMSQCESKEMVTPLCMWKLPNKEFISTDNAADQRHHQRLLMSYSPFGTPTLLAEQINMLGTFPGTIILFWNMRTDLDNVVWDPSEGCFMLSSCLQPGAGGPINSSKNGKESTVSAGTGDDMQVDTNNGSVSSTVTNNSGVGIYNQISNAQGFPNMPEFPLWKKARYSIDYCLPTYLFWSHLKSPACIYSQGTLLKGKLGPKLQHKRYACNDPSCVYCEVSPICNNTLPIGYTNNLYDFLKSNLHHCAELICLFSPQDHYQGAGALIGFLNDFNTPLHNRICEAGILLYFKNRLIRRYESTFPESSELLDSAILPPLPTLFEGQVYKYGLTAAISVPEWLVPSVTKQEFIHEGNAPYIVFQKKLKALIIEYLKVCRDPNLLNDWVENKNKVTDMHSDKVASDFASSSEDEYVPAIDSTHHSPRT